MKRTSVQLFLSIFLFAPSLMANVLWSSTSSTPPRHRNITNESGAPCGVGERQTPTLLNSGVETEVEWEEFIPQNGHFEIFFSPSNDSDWVLLKRIDNVVSPEDIKKSLIIHKTKIILPNVQCEACSLQIIQTVTDTVEAKYYSCSDIKITESGQEAQSHGKNECPE